MTSARHRSLPFAASLAIALGGAVIVFWSLGAINGGDAPTQADAPAPTAAPPAGSDTRAQTSFGSVSVDKVHRLIGADKPMGLDVPAGHLPIQIHVTVTNLRDEPLKVDESLFALEPAAATGGVAADNLEDGRVEPFKAHRVVLRYAVRRGDALPQLAVNDPEGGEALRVALGDPKTLPTLDVATHEFEGTHK